jgi:stage V sporulation protein B
VNDKVAASEERARTAGRGGIAVLAAKAFFIVIGLVQQTVLPSLIGLAGYGALSRVLAVASVVNNVVVSSSIQGVSRTVARARARGAVLEEQALRATLKVHVPLAFGLALAFALAAPLIGRFEGAPHIVLPLVVASGVVALYGLYAPLVGMLNGRSQFTRQAQLDMTFAVLRTIGLLGLGWLFVRRGLPGALGSLTGFVLAAACIVPLAARRAGTGRAGGANEPEVPSPGRYLAELAPLALAQLGTNVLMQVDITVLGRFLSQGAALSAAVDPAKAADEWVGVYRACQLFAFLPYQLLFSVTQVLFPMIARAKSEGDTAAVARYVARGTRIATIAGGLMITVIAAAPEGLLTFAYGPAVATRGHETLRILAVGQGAFAMLGIATTVLASLGRERLAATITTCACAAVCVACFLAIPQDAFGNRQLLSTATATSIALGLTLVAGVVAVVRVAGAFVPWRTAARVGIAVAVAVFAGPMLPHVGRFAVVLLAAAIGVAYVLFLIVTGELTRGDLDDVLGLVGRRAKRGA